MLERQGHLPGYTGHIPKTVLEEETGQAKGIRSQIPNYKGFIPGVKSENLIGKTYGRITEDSALGNFHRGLDIPKEELYQTVHQSSYTNQMRIPVMPLRPKEYPPPPHNPLDDIPEYAVHAFFGLAAHPPRHYPEELSGEYAQGQGETMGMAISQFFDMEHTGDEDTPKLSYEQARHLANSLNNS